MFRNNFYPRTLQESATHEFGHVVDATTISIHTPYKRVRQIVDTSNVDNYVFQSTHPTRECDPQLGGTTTTTLYFNPRTLQESATMMSMLDSTSRRNGISIHAPYKRVRPDAIVNGRDTGSFQSTHPTRECDAYKGSSTIKVFDFNPRTLQESATNHFL